MLTLREVGRHPQGASALQQLRKVYIITEAENGLMLSQKANDFRLFLYDMDEVLGAARRLQEPLSGPAAKSSASPNGKPDALPPTADLQAARRRITELEVRALQLEADVRVLAAERDHWKRRSAESEKARSDSGTGAAGTNDKRYADLRRFLAKRFHPDHADGTGMEKAIRGEVFKEVWAEIDRIDVRHR
jgi:hypothetical protein